MTVKGGQVNWSVKSLPVPVWGTTAWTSKTSLSPTAAFFGTFTLMRIGSQLSISARVTLLVPSTYAPKLNPVMVTLVPAVMGKLYPHAHRKVRRFCFVYETMNYFQNRQVLWEE